MTTPDDLTRLEHRLRDAYHAAAQTVRPATVRDLPVPADLARFASLEPDAGATGWTGRERRAAFRDRTVTHRLGVPAAAFAAIAAAVLAVTVVAPRLVGGGTTAAPLGPGGAPAFYVAIKTDSGSAVIGATELDIVSTTTGQVVAQVPSPLAGLRFQVVTAIGDHAFIAAAEPPAGATGVPCQSWLYRFSLTGQGQPEQVTRLMPVAGIVPLRQLAASADGRTIAFGRTGCSDAAVGSGRGQVVVARLAAAGPTASPGVAPASTPSGSAGPVTGTPPASTAPATTPPSSIGPDTGTPPASTAPASTPPPSIGPDTGTPPASTAPAGDTPGVTATVFTESPSAVPVGLGLSARGDQLSVMTAGVKAGFVAVHILVLPAGSPPGPLTQRGRLLLSDRGLQAMARSPAGPEVAGLFLVHGRLPTQSDRFAVGEVSTDGGAGRALQFVANAGLLPPPAGAAPFESFESRVDIPVPANSGRRRGSAEVQVAVGLTLDSSGQHALLFGWQQQSDYLNLATWRVTLVPRNTSSGRIRSAAW